jgi:hypothetical protein
MPTVNNTSAYRAIFSSASNLFVNLYSQPKGLNTYVKFLPKGSPLYRYTSYRNGPQTANSCLTIWNPLANDLGNRWTGNGVKVSAGSQGLYFSDEYFDKEKPFPELEHYMNSTDPNTAGTVSYYEYAPGKNPTKSTVNVESLRSMFLFTSKENLMVLDLSLSGGKDLLNKILNDAKELLQKAEPENKTLENKTLEDLYKDPNDASFDRAIGNALFEPSMFGINAIQTTSVRDGVSNNIVLKGVQGKPIDILKPEGRATFFVDSNGKAAKGVYTIADLQYNAQFEETGLDHLAPKETQVQMLGNIADGIGTNLSTYLSNAIEQNPPTDLIQNCEQRVERVNELMKVGDMTAALTEMAQISTELAKILPTKDLQQYEAKIFEKVQATVDSLSNITTTVSRANEEGRGNINDPNQEIEPVVDPPDEMLPETLARE